MLETAAHCVEDGIRMIDVRHEQAAAMMAQAYARVSNRVGVCMACSGPGVTNLTTGIANALVDCTPVVAIGGSTAIGHLQKGAFQEVDQVAIMRPVTKWADRVYEARRIPEYVNRAFRHAVAGKPGPVYLDIPGDVLYAKVEEDEVTWPRLDARTYSSGGNASEPVIAEIMTRLANAERPIVISGSGLLRSGGAAALQDFVEKYGVPFYTTPQGRGAVPEDHHFFYPHARSTAMREADFILVAGTRLNYVTGYGRPPRFSPDATIVTIDSDPEEIARNEHVEIGLVADAKAVLEQLNAAKAGVGPERFAAWRDKLDAIVTERRRKQEAAISTDDVPIHPTRLCKEIRDFMDRDAILVVDGQEILNYGRQVLPTFLPGHRLNSGPFGTMGVGLPFGVGAKAADPDRQVIVLHGDGSFGMNGMELDTAQRHNLPVLVVISLNGGWTADPQQIKAGRYLGYTRYEKMAEVLGCHAEFVEQPEDIRPALERASREVKAGRSAVVNVVTDWKARAQVKPFSSYMT